jgi:hypothetical protein
VRRTVRAAFAVEPRVDLPEVVRDCVVRRAAARRNVHARKNKCKNQHNKNEK